MIVFKELLKVFENKLSTLKCLQLDFSDKQENIYFSTRFEVKDSCLLIPLPNLCRYILQWEEISIYWLLLSSIMNGMSSGSTSLKELKIDFDKSEDYMSTILVSFAEELLKEIGNLTVESLYLKATRKNYGYEKLFLTILISLVRGKRPLFYYSDFG